MSSASYIPPLIVTRYIGTYHFEGGGYVGIVGDGNQSTEEMLDLAQEIINMKRAELAKKAGLDKEPTDG